MRWSSMSTSEEQPNGQGASHTMRNKSRIPVIPKSTFFNTHTCINFNSGSSENAASHTNNKVSAVLKTVCLHVGESCNGAQSERNQQYLAIGQRPRRQFHKSVVKAERKKIIVFGVLSLEPPIRPGRLAVGWWDILRRVYTLFFPHTPTLSDILAA